MALNGTRTLRGALAGAAGAAVWAAQQPLDKRVFGVDYDDVELLGKIFTRGPAWLPDRARRPRRQRRAVRRALRQRRSEPPRPARRARPDRRAGRAPRDLAGDAAARPPASRRAADFPALWGNPRAFAQATWRHALFGFVMGELERRLNPPADSPAPIDDAAVASNGHGSAEHLVAVEPV